MEEQKAFSFLKKVTPEEVENRKQVNNLLNSKPKTLEEKRKLLDQAITDSGIASLDGLRHRKINDQDILKVISNLEKIYWALRDSDFDRMVYNEKIDSRLSMLESKLDALLNKL